MRRCVIALILLLVMSSLPALARVWEPPPGHTEIPLWPRTPPSASRSSGPESEATETKELVAGRPWVYESNVSRPTITVFSPRTKTGIAVVVFPGGGYQILAMDLEGSEVCDWLTSSGLTCILLKYRVRAPQSPPKLGSVSPIRNGAPGRTTGARPRALQCVAVADQSAQGRSARILGRRPSRRRDQHALCATIVCAVNAADKESCRPDFAVALYPGHLAADRNLKLNPALPVTNRTPPTFLLQAEDDYVDSVDDSLAYYIALKNSGVPVEMHLYAHGGHAFGIRRTAQPITEWPTLVKSWLANLIQTKSI